MTAPLPDHLKGKFRLQRLALLWEVGWSALQLPLVMAMVGLTLLWSSLLNVLPRPLPLIAILLLAAGFLWSLRGLFRLRGVEDFTALRKLDASNDLHHREASST
ncbi:MAG: DUF4175 family protein, partial [Aestuariivirga sp.]